MNCSASIQASAACPPQPSSPYAEEGTRAHEVFARCLFEGRQARDLLDDPVITPPLQEALNHARRIIGDRPVLIEQRLPPIPWLPDLWGTADIVVFDHHRHAEAVVDLKFGAYIPVEADTPQTGIYGLLAAARFGLSRNGLTTWIIQPRYVHPDGPVRSHYYNKHAMRALLDAVTAATEQTRAAGAVRTAGPWCRFCAAAASCPEQRAFHLQSLSMFSKEIRQTPDAAA